MIELFILLLIFIVLIIPTGKYIYHIMAGEKTFADPVFNKVDRFIFKICRIDTQEMNWKKYVGALLMTNILMMVVSYVILRIQTFLPGNPNGAAGMTPSLAFNTVISFMTNTNLQHYAGETGLTYFSQMAVITMMMFTSAASGLAVAMAFMRGISGKFQSLGNFYRDFVKIITHILLPLSMIVGILLVSQGVIQNLAPNVEVKTLEGTVQTIPMGPVASMESIKHLGTNGGGFFGANSAHPFENPNVFTNTIEMLAMMLMPGATVVAFGYCLKQKRKECELKRPSVFKNQAMPIFTVMLVLFVAGAVLLLYAENGQVPVLKQLGISNSFGNLEGKELRFGINQSSIFSAVTTAFTTGSINNMHDTLTPMGGFVTLINMMLNVVFGGKGVGLINMLIYVILTVFICGLMVGRTPEYVSKKIEGKEMKLAALSIIIHPLLILVGTALAVSLSVGISSITNLGFHGLSQVLYEFASSAANNGSGFEGLLDNTAFWNISTGIVMFLGRYLSIIIALAIAQSLMMKPAVNASIGTLNTNTKTFTIALLMVVLIIAALTFLPVLVLGPIAEALKFF